MKRKRRAEIIFEASRTTVYTTRPRIQTRWCSSCSADVEMITAPEAARVAGVSFATIDAWVAAGKLHHGATSTGALIICLRSLSA